MQEIRSLEPGDLEQAWELDREAFQVPAERRERFLSLDPAQIVGAFEGARLVGIAGAHPLRQSFGGRAVPMGGVHSVAVAPDRRSRGLGRRLLRELLARIRARGEALAVLFPATTRPYRGVGFELAGAMCWRRIAPRALERLPRPSQTRLCALAPRELERIAPCYAEVAGATNGFLVRSEAWWEATREHFWRGRRAFAAEDAEGRVTGYLVYRPMEGEYTSLGGPFRLAIDEILWSERDAGLALWGLLASWAPQVDAILYRSCAEDPLLLLLPEQELELVAELRWMARLVDPVAAVAARGFAEGLDVEAELELEDPLFRENEGRFVLRVAKGRGELAPGGRGGLRLDTGALASLFTGHATPDALARAGRLVGAPGHSRAALGAAFAGPTPWMLDQF